MDRMIVAVFGDEKQAYDGTRALHELHDEGSITLYAEAVITKDSSGKANVRAPQTGPSAVFVGSFTGGLLGLLGGPAGVVAGAASGGLVGAAADVNVDISAAFLREVAQHLAPRKAAVVAEIDEEWQTPVDSRMEALGGTIFRKARIDVEDAYVERETAADKAEFAALKAELAKAAADRKATLHTRIEAVRRKLQEKHDRVKSRVEEVKQEGEAKIASLKEQASKVHGDAKATVEQRVAEVRADYQTRAAKLGQARELMKSALAA